MYISLVLFVILMACVAMLFRDGLWSNAVRLINVVFSALLAMNYFEPLARYLETQGPSYTFVCDFASLWGIFAISMIVLSVLTDTLSKVKVKFLKIVDQIGGIVISFFIGLVMVSFTLTTFHTAPLSKDFMGFSTDQNEKMFLFGPDRLWLGFAYKESKGFYAQPKPTSFSSLFLPTYHFRRAKCQAYNERTGEIRITPGKNWWDDQ